MNILKLLSNTSGVKGKVICINLLKPSGNFTYHQV
jgi:hypothetical protein